MRSGRYERDSHTQLLFRWLPLKNERTENPISNITNWKMSPKECEETKPTISYGVKRTGMESNERRMGRGRGNEGTSAGGPSCKSGRRAFGGYKITDPSSQRRSDLRADSQLPSALHGCAFETRLRQGFTQQCDCVQSVTLCSFCTRSKFKTGPFPCFLVFTTWPLRVSFSNTHAAL
jgi:hypothetical protein